MFSFSPIKGLFRPAFDGKLMLLALIAACLGPVACTSARPQRIHAYSYSAQTGGITTGGIVYATSEEAAVKKVTEYGYGWFGIEIMEEDGRALAASKSYTIVADRPGIGRSVSHERCNG
jgi:hypothetical protein